MREEKDTTFSVRLHERSYQILSPPFALGGIRRLDLADCRIQSGLRERKDESHAFSEKTKYSINTLINPGILSLHPSF